MSEQQVEIKKSTDFTMFVPAFIDEYGFSPAQFRIFARIMRRSLGADGQACYESVQRLSLNLGISKRIVQESLKILEKAKCIKVVRREGMTHLVAFRPCNEWVSKMEFDSIVLETTGKRVQRDRERKMTPSAETLPLAETRQVPSAETRHKGTPIEGDPINKNVEATSSSEKPKKNNDTSPFGQALRKYQDEYAKPTTAKDAIANNIAINKLEKLSNGDVDTCIAIHKKLQAEGWRSVIDWTTVHREYNHHVKSIQPKQQPTDAMRDAIESTRQMFYGTN